MDIFRESKKTKFPHMKRITWHLNRSLEFL